ncbi:MAG: glycosyl hydrolase, partial [bacterium]|nr:glycosyl hydrolase [bacterium]
SAIHKSTDGGRTWRKLKHGLPKVDLGRIGLDISPADPDVIYAIIEAADDKSGFYRSTNRGETWKKRSEHKTSSPQYYNEIVCDPQDVDRVYALDTFLNVTQDGGKTFKRVPRAHRHVDDHALWIDPNDTDYLLVGCDGGVYESFERGENWAFKANLPVTQFYRVAVDDSKPFYYVYGGTQDNNTMGGPSRTTSRAGITNEDWFVTVGGDGYETQIDPVDPNIVYSQWQYGGLVRYDRRSGQRVDIKPREAPGDAPYRWNWDSPLIISPHHHQRLYFAAHRLFRSDNRGDSWRAVSGDLTRQLDRNALEVMGRFQSVDAVAKHGSTSIYGNIVALTESPLVEGLIYVGTDDGLVQVTEDGGGSWRKVAEFPSVPEMTYVSFLATSPTEPDTVFAAFDNHKNGDFKPYLLQSGDRGRTWTSIAGDLPERDVVYAVAQDHVQPQLLFAGTEFGVYFTVDGGGQWIRLKGGIPTIAVRDLELQRRANDLVLGTFGRGFYILDDYTPLRQVNATEMEAAVIVFPVADALRYIESARLGGSSGRGSQGAAFYAAPNPPFGAVFTYYLKDKITTRKERRQKAEKKAAKEDSTTDYPTTEDIRAEDDELKPAVVLTVRDDSGAVVRRITGSRKAGIHRVAWDLRYPASTPTRLKPPANRAPWDREPSGPLALPGTYVVTLGKRVDGQIVPLADLQEFDVVPLELTTFAAEDRAEVLGFQRKVARLQRAVRGALKAADEAETRLKHLRKAILDTPAAGADAVAEVDLLRRRLRALLIRLRGDSTKQRLEEPTPPSIRQRVDRVVGNQWAVTTPPTQTQREAYEHAGVEFAVVLAELQTLIEKDLRGLETKLDEAGAPWTPGRVPSWQME